MMPEFPLTSTDNTAVIVGAHGQDGFYLNKSLQKNGVKTALICRRYVELPGKFKRNKFSILDPEAVLSLLTKIGPAQIYYLAAYHRSSEDPSESTAASWSQSYAIHIQGLINFLDAMAKNCPESSLLYAASSHVFGNPFEAPQTEETPFRPINVYGITKGAGVHLCKLYREKYGVKCCASILFNHESPRRAPSYVGRKIVRAAVEIKNGRQERLVLGDLHAKIDWGAAQDYVEAMRLILNLEKPGEFIVASGELHSISEFVDVAFDAVGLDPTKYIQIDDSLITKSRQLRPLVGDTSKLERLTGWKRQYSFENIILSMVEQEQAGGLGL